MVAMGRSVTLGSEASFGHTVWALLCQAALRSIDWAAGVWGVKDAHGQAERAELFSGYGSVTQRAAWAHRSVDWAKLDEFDRGRIAREAQTVAGAPPRRSSELRTPAFFD
jgi:hypothetical protein